MRRLWILAVLLCGCGDELPAAWRAAIINGTIDSGHPAVGLLNLPGGGYCTATLIGTRTALTAGHCVEEGAVSLTLGGYPYPVDRVLAHPGYRTGSIPDMPSTLNWTNTDMLMDDVGLVFLKNAVGIVPVPIATAAPSLKQPLTLVGYGLTASGDTSPAEKRVATNIVGALGVSYFFYSTTPTESGLTCNGDSGGPSLTLEAGEERILGVHSMVDCYAVSYDMSAPSYLDWIRSQVAGDLAQPRQRPPTVKIASPGVDLQVGQELDVEVAGDDPDGDLASIVLRVDGVERGRSSENTLQVHLAGLSAGAHELRAEALDRTGLAASDTRQVKVGSGPSELGAADDPGEAEHLEDELLVGGCSVGGSPGNGIPWLLLGLALALRGLRRSRRC